MFIPWRLSVLPGVQLDVVGRVSIGSARMLYTVPFRDSRLGIQLLDTEQPDRFDHRVLGSP